MDVVSSLNDGLLGGVFVSGVVVDDGDGAFFADVSIDVELVETGISDVELRLEGGMESLDLLSVCDKIIPFKDIPCIGGDGDGQFQAEIRLNREGVYSVVSEDHFLFGWILLRSSETASCLHIGWEARAFDGELSHLISAELGG